MAYGEYNGHVSDDVYTWPQKVKFMNLEPNILKTAGFAV